VQSEIIWMDGELVPDEKAMAHFIPPTLYHGDRGSRACCYQSPDGPALSCLLDPIQRFVESIHIPGVLNLAEPDLQPSGGKPL